MERAPTPTLSRFAPGARVALAALVALVALAGCADPVSYPDVPAADAGPFTCLPNLDGQIDATELGAAVGVPITYEVSAPGVPQPVDLVGQVDGSGKRIWDFSPSLATDVPTTIQASALEGKWYVASFPGGQWSAPVDVAGSIEGVYSADSAAIYLLGLASADPAPKEGKTLVVYGAPVALYRFPIKADASWISTGTVTGGMLRGLAYAGTDTYESADVAVGQVLLHDYTFTQVHRVRTKATVTPSVGQAAVTRQDSFLFECFGEVVRATSKVGEASDDFTTAAELRRLASQ
jgi:hypothetical protein